MAEGGKNGFWAIVRRSFACTTPAVARNCQVFVPVFLIALLCPAPLAARSPVDLELVLAVDTSGSVDMSELVLQMRGLTLAFRDPAVIAAIEATGPAGIAVTLVHWSSAGQQRQVVPWTRLYDDRSARQFAAAIAGRPERHFFGSTGIGAALIFAERLIRTNRFEGRRKSIDIAADGANNSGIPPRLARNDAVAAGVTINGLTILDDVPHLRSYFEQNVIGGAGAFVIAVSSYADIIAATRAKLLREISVSVARAPAPANDKEGKNDEPAMGEPTGRIDMGRLGQGRSARPDEPGDARAPARGRR